ncbi:MAG TPA: efflux RND transporter permease subunit [Kofleriaceae bacterium]|nr:efflux RND transporter permease subunit [Kofleriaceae bacterium]
MSPNGVRERCKPAAIANPLSRIRLGAPGQARDVPVLVDELLMECCVAPRQLDTGAGRGKLLSRAMWLIKTALRRPYTFVVMALLIALAGGYSIVKTPTDIFPKIDIPVVSVVWNYGGLPPEEMEKRIVNNFERFVTTIVADIDHIESQTTTGLAIVKIYLQPGASVEKTIAQTTAVAQSAVRSMPPGTVPPLIMQYSATSVPIMQIALESDSLSEQQMFDYGINFIRTELVTVPGTQIPYPYGGVQRQIMVDIDPPRLHALGLSPRDVQAALAAQNVILPSGTAKLGTNEYPVMVKASPATLEELASIPIKTVDGTPVYLRDVANVRDGNMPQTNMVHVEGRRSLLMSVLKNGDASTLDVTAGIHAALPRALDRLPKEVRDQLRVKVLFDQSVFVRASVEGVVHEAVIAGVLTAMMILMFLGSWRSTVTVIISIPLSILFSIIVLKALGQTLNVMTLGGLALAVGILVDDATVAVENIHRNIGQRKPFVQAIIDGAQQVSVPALVSTLCICIVFAPIAFLTGAAKSLFVPLAMAVVFAMLMSYLLSRTLVPTLVHYLLRREAMSHHAPNRFAAAFDRGFNRFRDFYGRGLAWTLVHRPLVIVGFLAFAAGSLAMLPMVGRDFFPTVDAGLIKLHVRNAPGMRLEESEKRMVAIQKTIREVIPDHEIATMIDVMGTPYSGINMSLSEGALISPADAQVMIALEHGHRPTAEYLRELRRVLRTTYPDSTFFFLAPDISTQVLNFGLAAPINLQVVGPIGSEAQTLAFARDLAAKVSQLPGAADVHLAQVPEVPGLALEIDRVQAQRAGLTERDVASDLLVSLASSGQVAPSFWIDRRGVQYTVSVQTPQRELDSIDALRATPISTGRGTPATVGNLSTIHRTTSAANITHHNIARTYDVQANVDGTDLGTVTDAVREVVAEARKTAPRGTRVTLKGQAESMDSSFDGLASGLAVAILLVYLLLVVNFQSWLDPLIILMALPGALAGIVWILFLTGTTLSVPALIGSIMCVGVATANSILVVSFANEQRAHRDARGAALAAGMTRLRPVLMTALAMVIGMVPMAIGLGEGGEQNAPLGRAVIGGLSLATFTTLFFVPVMYSLLRRKPPARDQESVV